MGVKKNLTKMMIGCFGVRKRDEPDMSMLEYYSPPSRDETVEVSMREMALTAAETLVSLKAQTECCRREIEMLRCEIHELRKEQINRSLDTGFSDVSGFSTDDEESLTPLTSVERSNHSRSLWRAEAAMHAKLYEAVEAVAQKVPQFLDFPTHV